MKSVKFYIGLMLIAFIGLTGCKDDVLVEGNAGQVEEGIPTTVSINFSTTPQKKLSRAEQTPEAEYNVSTIYLFAFNARGEKTGGQAFAVNGTEATGTYRDESFTGTINGFNVLTGSRQRLYAIANYNNGDFDLSEEILNAIDTEAELLDLSIATRNKQLLLNHLSFVMEGEEENVTVSINNNRQGVITLSDGGDVDIELKRLNAKITFDVTADVDGVIEGTLKFVPKSYMVMKVPLNASVVNQNTNLSDAEYASMSEESDKEDKAPITLFDEVEDTHCSFTFYMLENYSAPPEKGETGSASGLWIDEEAKAKENDGIESLYALREKEYKKEILEAERDPNYPGKTEENTGYKYAPNTATYVVIKGDLSYQRTNNGTTEYVNVSAEYTIHLGETGKATDADNEERVNNYTVARNVHYTYTIKLTGINSYDVEVNDDREVRPGVEGDVVIAGDQVRAIDCHYARTRIKFTRTALQKGLSWIVQTPFDEGMKVADSDQNSLKDYKWVLFAVNKEFGVKINDRYNRTMVKFPGYEAYDGGVSTTNGVQTNANSDEGNNFSDNRKWKERVRNSNNYYAESNNNRYWDNLLDDACLRDVNQLINHLRKIAEDDTKWSNVAEEDENRESVVYVTAFIDEYVYIYNPETQEYKIPDANVDDPDRLILWKQVVNGRDRLMHICTEGAKYSPDGESSWSNSVLTIRQSPIYSIYNELDSDIKSAWGTESILETPALPIIPENTNNTIQGIYNGMSFKMDNGRYNTLNFFGKVTNNSDGTYSYTSSNVPWTDVLSRDANNIGTGDDQKENELQSRYRDVWHACMTRNRDLDGDNVIDREEIRWVMASIDELTDLWIGENALPETAHLYQGNGIYMEHVVSSSGEYTYQEGDYWNNGYNWVRPWIIWAEEGASRGQYNDGSYTDEETESRDYKYRCIRYLGIPLDNIDDIPEDYVTVTQTGWEQSDNGVSYQIDLSKLDYSARRQSSDGGYELPRHYERGNDGNNRPYRAFEVLVTPQGEGARARHWTEDNITGFKDMVNFSNSSKLCPSGYRVPNQRELMLMYTSLNNSQGYNVSWGSGESYWSSTQFSFNGKGLYSANDRPGFATDASNMILTSTTQSAWDNVSGKVRCVRDVTE